jgi:tetratricopeptide (TPR) repeat protein
LSHEESFLWKVEKTNQRTDQKKNDSFSREFQQHEREKRTKQNNVNQMDLAVLDPKVSHPSVANCLNNLGELYRAQGKYADAELLFQRALNILDEVLGSEHPTTQTVRRNYENLLKKMESEKG